MNWKEKALSVSIAILSLVFLIVGLDAIYPAPEYSSPQHEIYLRNTFIFNIALGTTAVIAGSTFVPAGAKSVGSGLMWGGILIIIYGVIRYFGEMDKILRLIVVGTALIILIYIGLKSDSPK